MGIRGSNRSTFAAVAVTIAVLAGMAVPVASPAGQAHSKKVTCKGPSSLGGTFNLESHRKIKGKRTDCRTAVKVAKRFPKSCASAYAAQGRCKIRASARWRCRSRIVGSLADGAPSKEKCKHRRSKLKFVVSYTPPIGGPGFTPLREKRSGPFNAGGACIETSQSGKLIPPPPLAEAPFEIHVLGDVPESKGKSLQKSLLDHKVAKVLNNGLAEQPRAYPGRVPILLTPHKFNPTGWTGLTLRTCDDPQVDAIVVRTDKLSDQTDSVVAHELFHAYSYAISPFETWWEEASATWSQGKDGYPEEAEFDVNLQYPDMAIDSTKPSSYPYAMSRFIQFLDDEGLVGGGNGRWQLEREVISGYPNATATLAGALEKRGTNLGEQVAAFWGDRIRAKPLHGPQLHPKGPNDKVEVKPETTEIKVDAKPLHTKLRDFTLDNDVKRVEFEFDAPKDGYFWGATTENESRRFEKGDSVSFCVDGSDQDDLEWPAHFPVTFTNGNRAGGELEGTITVRATKDASHCNAATPDNRACHLLHDAKVGSLLGPGLFPYHREDSDGQSVTWICFYHGSAGEVDLNLLRARKLSSKEVRENAKKQIEQLGLNPLKNVGDVAGIGQDTAQGKTYNIVVFAVAKEIGLFTLAPADGDKARTLAKRLAGQLD